MPPPIHGILETSLYTDDLDRLEQFYRQILGFETIYADERMRALKIGPASVLLLFERGASVQGTQSERGFIPGHDGQGPVHLTFAIDEADIDRWRTRLQSHGIPILSEVPGMGGGLSLYFHDPDSHVLEIAPPHIWEALMP